MTYTTPPPAMPDDLREAVARAYQSGAEAVHKAWVDCGGNCPGEPDFWEAASDYADGAALTALQPALDAAREEGRAAGRTAEREFVVAWLWQNQTLAQYHWGPPIINAIERGDHTKGEK